MQVYRYDVTHLVRYDCQALALRSRQLHIAVLTRSSHDSSPCCAWQSSHCFSQSDSVCMYPGVSNYPAKLVEDMKHYATVRNIIKPVPLITVVSLISL